MTHARQVSGSAYPRRGTESALVTGMATTAGRGRVLDVSTPRAVSCCLIWMLFTSGCAVSGPPATEPPALSAADREACEEFAEKAKALVQGASMGSSVVKGAGEGAGVVDLHGSGGLGAVVVAVGIMGVGAVVGGVVGALSSVARNASARDAGYAEAMDACLRPVLLTRELEPEHPEVGRSLHALAYRYHRLAEFSKAEPLYARALAIQEKTLGPDAPEVATILEGYAVLLRQTDRAVEADELERRARAMRGKP